MAKSMSLNQAAGLGGMLKDGFKCLQGVDEAVAKNIIAVKQLADITKTSLGPNGMNKLVIDHLEKTYVTSDSACIVNQMEVVHPAAKMVVMAAKMQEKEFGDGTNLMISLTGELLSGAAELIRMGLHPAEIVKGYQKSYDKLLGIIETLVVMTLDNLRDEAKIIAGIRTTLSAKQFGNEDLLAKLVAKACLISMPAKANSLKVDNVRVCKILGGSIDDSLVVKGFVVQRATEGSVVKVENAKVAVFGCGIEASGTEAKGTVLLKNATELMNYSKGEENRMEEAVQAIKASGVSVVVAGGSISEMAAHFLGKYHLLSVKITSKWELRRLCRSIGATALVRLGAPTPEEMGRCDLVQQREIGGRNVTVFEQYEETSRLSTIILRSSTHNQLNDLERAIGDGISCVKAMCADSRFVAGGGACELELARKLRAFGEASPGLDQYAIQKFADAMEIVPRTLARNVGSVANDVMSALYTAHAAGETHVGVGVEESQGVSDKAAEGIVDHLATKNSAIRLSVDTAITVLRVDQIIMAKAAGGPKLRPS